MRGSAVFRTGVAPGGALAGPWVRNSLWRSARAVPSLDLRFADNKSLVDAVTGASLVTFTRAADVASITGTNFSSFYNQTEGTVFAECSALLNTNQGICIFRDSASSTTNIRLRKTTANAYSGVLRDGGGTKDIVVTPSPALTAGQNIKIALGFKTNDCAFTGGGQTPGTQNTFTLASMNTFDINGSVALGESAANTTIKRLAFWPTRLATLQAITQP